MTRSPVERWKGGNLRVFAWEISYEPAPGRGTENEPPRVRQKSQRKLLGHFAAEPYGHGLALLLDEKLPRGIRRASRQIESGLWLDVEVRDGRPQVIGLRSEPGGPELTQKLLRFPLDREVGRLVAERTVSLNHDDEGVFGSYPARPPGWYPEPVERAGDIPELGREDAVLAVARPKATGRPRLPEEKLREVLTVAENARAGKQDVNRAVAEHFGVPYATARGWLWKARKRLVEEAPSNPRRRR